MNLADELRRVERSDARVRHVVARRAGRQVLIEELARLPVEVDYGSEYRYRDPIPTSDAGRRDHAVGRDRRHAGRAARGQRRARSSIAICNVVGSMATRETEGTIYTHAGPEIGVASTKAFTSQLVALHLLALHLGAGARHAPRRRAAAPRGCSAAAAPHRAGAAAPETRSRRSPPLLQARTRLPVSRARHQLPDRARGRAEAQGDLLHPRRGLPGRRDEARPDRAHRREDAGRGDRAATTTSSRRCSATSRKPRPAAASVIARHRGRRHDGLGCSTRTWTS
jgi:hypothetical protein